MSEDLLAPFLLTGESPEVAGAVAFPPVLSRSRPWVAFATKGTGQNTLLVTDYENQDILCAYETSARPVVFSPDGTRLLAKHDGDLWVFSPPWEPPLTIAGALGDTSSHAWIDAETVLAVGSGADPDYPVPTVVIINTADESVRLVDPGDLTGVSDAMLGAELMSAACSGSGAVAILGVVDELERPGRELFPGYRGPSLREFRLAVFSLSDPERISMGRHSSRVLYRSPKVGLSADGLNVQVVDRTSLRRFRVDHAVGELEAAGETESGFAFRGSSFCGGMLLVELDPIHGRQHRRRVRVLTLNDRLDPLYGGSVDGTTPISNPVEFGDGIRFAAGHGGRALVFELNDPDMVALASEQTVSAITAARRLGERRMPEARKPLEDRLGHDDPELRLAAVVSLGMIAAPESAPVLIRFLGRREPSVDTSEVKAAIDLIDRSHLKEALPQALRGNAPDRRGAVRYLGHQPYADALDGLHECVFDRDPEIRRGAVDALGRLGDLRGLLPLLGAFGDEEEAVRVAALRALTETLRLAGRPTAALLSHLDPSLDLLGFAQEVVDTGHLPDSGATSAAPLAGFLQALVRSIEVDGSLDDLRNAIERMTTPRGDLPRRAAKAMGLVVSLMFAEDLRAREQLVDAASTYRYAASLAVDAQVPSLLWRCQKAVGECYAALKQDRSAAEAYEGAMDTIDRLWFALLEDGELRGFFAEKADLYEQAALCNLRLGHAALALECLEKAKTRYLGDLIARRHKKRRTALARDISTVWRIANDQTPPSVLVAAISPQAERVIITGVTRVDDPTTMVTIYPERLADLEEAMDSRRSPRRSYWGVRAMWDLAAHLMAQEDVPDEYAQPLTDLHESLQDLRLAGRTKDLPIPDHELGSWHERFRDTVGRVLSLGDEFRLLHDLAPTFEAWAYGKTEADDWLVHLEALVEPLDLALGREVVHGRAVLDDPDRSEAIGRLRFEYAAVASEQSDLSLRGTAVQQAFERISTGKWRYVARVARGETASFQRSTEIVRATTRTAQVHFAVTNQGTVAYVTSAELSGAASEAAFPGPADHLEVLSMPALTLDCLRARLIEDPNGWFRRYEEIREKKRRVREWFGVMDSTLEWLSRELWMPVHQVLLRHGVDRVRIIPHRVLHLIPFAALPLPRKRRGQQRLVDVFDLHTAPSVTLYDICNERTKGAATRPLAFSAVCDPTEDLPFSGLEVRDQLDRLPAGSTQVLKRAQATLRAVSDLELGARFHFAGHASYDWAEPLDSRLCFHDEELFLVDLFEESFPVQGLDLVTLSACETSLVEPDDPADEWLGLASGFLFGGARRVISTLWAVNDHASAVLMAKFYELHLGDGVPADRALGKAQRWVRDKATRKTATDAVDAAIAELRAAKEEAKETEKKEAFSQLIDGLERGKASLPSRGRRPFAHPYYWAGFNLSGAVE